MHHGLGTPRFAGGSFATVDDKLTEVGLIHDLQLVIFDCDGVLVDSEVISNRVLATMLTAEGLPTTLAEARRDYQGLLLADVVTRAQEELGRALPEDWLAQYERDRSEAFHRELGPVPGATEAVQRISAAGVAVCVASQGKLEKTRLSLGLTGLRHLFPAGALFSAYSVPQGNRPPTCSCTRHRRWKPSPLAARSWRTPPPGSRRRYQRGCAHWATSPIATRLPCGGQAPR